MASNSIPPVFDQPGAGFTLMPDGIKYPPIEYGWQKPERAHNFQEATEHAGNVGVLAGIGPYGGLDQDEPAAFEGLTLPEHSTKWETRPGRFGMWFSWHDRTPEVLAKYGKPGNISQIYLYDSNKIVNGIYSKVGEVKLERAYQVIPPSWKILDDGSRAEYRLLDASPPAEWGLDRLLSDLLKIGIVFSKSPKNKESRLKTNIKKLEALPQNAAKKAKDKTAKAKEFFNRALQAGSAPHCRNESGFDLACQLRDLGLTADEAADYMLSYARGVPAGDHAYTEDDALESLRQAFSREPRDPPISEERRRHEETIKTLPEMVKADPRSIKDPAVVEALAALYANDPIEYDLVLAEIKKNCRDIRLETVRMVVEKHIADRQPAANAPECCPGPEVSEDITTAAREILEHGDPLAEHQNYVTEKVCGGEKPARAITLSGYSAYVEGDRLHSDVVGGAQSGKSTTTITALECFPDENVLIASEASPKSLYYLAHQQPERLKDAIIYIDDARPEHIPVLKTFRNESSVRPTNITVADGEFLELKVQYRPIVIASAVTPLRDHEGQATSRAILVSVPDATEEEEKKVREKIRQQIATSAILSQKTDAKRLILQQMVRILRDEGIRNVAIPYDVIEPKGADRRGTGQFMRLIKVLAFINQFQRPIIEMQDGRMIVLATYADFLTATRIWFDFAEGQEFKISPKAVDVLKALPEKWPGKAAPTIAKEQHKSQRSTERYLEDLYEAGIASRERITAPGMPYGYWMEPETRQKALSQIPESEERITNSVRIATTKFCREYVAENQPDSLKDSYIKFFSNSDIDIKKMYYGGKELSILNAVDPAGWSSLYTPLFSGKSCRDSEKEPNDGEIITTKDLSLLSENPHDSDLVLSQIGGKIVAIPPGEDAPPVLGKIDRPTPAASTIAASTASTAPPAPGPEQARDCASCPVAIRGDKTAIKCDPCFYLPVKEEARA